MHLLTGINHVAVVTEDLDRFVDFYTEVFELDVVFEEATPAFRHAILRTGETSWLHPAEVAGNPHGAAVPAMFDRGHLDHVALTASSLEAFAAVRGAPRGRGCVRRRGRRPRRVPQPLVRGPRRHAGRAGGRRRRLARAASTSPGRRRGRRLDILSSIGKLPISDRDDRHHQAAASTTATKPAGGGEP